MNVSIAVVENLVILWDVVEEDKGFPMHYLTLTEITTIWRYSYISVDWQLKVAYIYIPGRPSLCA